MKKKKRELTRLADLQLHLNDKNVQIFLLLFTSCAQSLTLTVQFFCFSFSHAPSFQGQNLTPLHKHTAFRSKKLHLNISVHDENIQQIHGSQHDQLRKTKSSKAEEQQHAIVLSVQSSFNGCDKKTKGAQTVFITSEIVMFSFAYMIRVTSQTFLLVCMTAVASQTVCDVFHRSCKAWCHVKLWCFASFDDQCSQQKVKL